MILSLRPERIGKKLFSAIDHAGGFARLAFATFRELWIPPFPWKASFDQLLKMGVESLPLIYITGLACGAVMALQFGHGLARFGGTLYVPKITSLSIFREMGPVFTSLLIAGRVGSGMASEISSMKVTQQIDAIRALGTSPIQVIVIPRVLSLMIALPILTVIVDYLGLFSAMLISRFELNIPFGFFLAKILETITVADVVTGLVKTIVFAFFIAITACFRGLNSQGGTEGVGVSTTWVVVTSSIFIMISDYFLTKLFIITVFPQF